VKAFVKNIFIEQGTTWTMTVKFYQDEAKTQPIDFSSCTGECAIRESFGNLLAEPVVSFPGNGAITMTLDKDALLPTVTASQYSKPVYGTYSCKVISLDGTAERWLNGSCIISPEETK